MHAHQYLNDLTSLYTRQWGLPVALPSGQPLTPWSSDLQRGVRPLSSLILYLSLLIEYLMGTYWGVGRENGEPLCGTRVKGGTQKYSAPPGPAYSFLSSLPPCDGAKNSESP